MGVETTIKRRVGNGELGFDTQGKMREAVNATLNTLDSGEACVAEKIAASGLSTSG